MSEIKQCPFCGSEDIYETYSQEYSLGTKNPEIFCNSCKAIFAIEDDSPYMNCDEDYVYRKAKTKEAWNRRATDSSAEPQIIHCKDCKLSDSISREDAIKAIYKSTEKFTGFLAMEMYTEEDAINAIKSVPSAEQWIPCSERLPEEDGQYLITVKYVHVDGYEDIYAEHGDWADGKWDMLCFGHCGEVESIIAWMPLPKPYERGTE